MEDKRIIYLIKCIDKRVIKYIEKENSIIENNELTPIQNWILAYLFKNMDKDIFQKDIEVAMNMSKSTATEKLQLMESLGYIKRVPLESDGRLKKIIILEKGINVQTNVLKTFDNLEKIGTTNFSDLEIKELKSLLARFIANLDERN